jgi:hypothetical protein
MPKISPEQRRFQLTSKCPRCGRFIRATFLASDGSKVPLSHGFLQPSSYVSAMCPKCHGTWQIRVSQQPAPLAEPAVHITESGRSEEPIGDELRRVDNSASSTTVTRRLRVSKRWLQKCEVQTEHAHNTTQGIDLSASTLATFRTTAETAVKQHYSVTVEDEQTFDEEIELTVPARTTTELRLHWKRLWQQGYATVTNDSGTDIAIPFRLLLGVTFDQESHDL